MHTSISKKLLAGLLSVVMVLSLFAAIPANNAQAASVALSGNGFVSSGITNTYKITNLSKTQYAKVSVSGTATTGTATTSSAKSSVSVKKANGTVVTSATKIYGTGKTFSLKVKSTNGWGKEFKLTVKVYNKSTNKLVKTLTKNVKVWKKTKDITLDQTSATVDADSTVTLTATTSPASYVRPVKWSSSNEAVATVVDGVVTGVAEGTATITALSGFRTAEATITVEDDRVPEIVSAVAVDSKTVKVTFNTKLANVSLLNFDINTTDVAISTVSLDGKVVTLTLGQALTSAKEYEVVATDISSKGGKKAASDLKAKFTWTYSDGISIKLKKEVKTVGNASGISLVDENGTAVNTVTSINVYTTNTNVVVLSDDAGATYALGTTVSGTAVNKMMIKAVGAGTADITVKIKLVTGELLTQTFTITVAKASESLKTNGYTLVDNDYVYSSANTVDFLNNVTPLTSLKVGETLPLEMFDTVNGDPQDAAINFIGATITEQNPSVASAVVSGSSIYVTGVSKGTASFKAKLADNTTRTFSITVKEKSKLVSISLSATSVVLSDESLTTANEGVNQKTVYVYVYFLDQYGDYYAPTADELNNLTIATTNTSGLTLSANKLIAGTAWIVGTGCSASFTITAVPGQTVNGATVAVTGFKKATDTTASYSGKLSVKVNDVDITNDKVTDIEIVSNRDYSIDANGEWDFYDGSYHWVTEYDLTKHTKIYVLNQNGLRIGAINPSALSDGTNAIKGSYEYAFSVAPSVSKEAVGKYKALVTAGSKKVEFAVTDAYLQMQLSGSETYYVDLTAAGVTKTLEFKYKNSLPTATSVSLNQKSVDISGISSVSVEDIIFGLVDPTDMLKDGQGLYGSADDAYYAISSTASLNGYTYNTPVLTVKDQFGKDLAVGTSIYGLLAGATSQAGSIFSIDPEDGTTYGSLVAEYNITNVVAKGVSLSAGTGYDTSSTVAIALSSGDSVTFTVVITSVYISELAPADQVNLLSAPVSLNVSLSN